MLPVRVQSVLAVLEEQERLQHEIVLDAVEERIRYAVALHVAPALVGRQVPHERRDLVPAGTPILDGLVRVLPGSGDEFGLEGSVARPPVVVADPLDRDVPLDRREVAPRAASRRPLEGVPRTVGAPAPLLAVLRVPQLARYSRLRDSSPGGEAEGFFSSRVRSWLARMAAPPMSFGTSKA